MDVCPDVVLSKAFIDVSNTLISDVCPDVVDSNEFIDVSKLPRRVVMVVEKFASSPKAAASSFNVFKVVGAESTKVETAFWTKAVVAICVVFVLVDAVGAVGVPVKAGLAFVA